MDFNIEFSLINKLLKNKFEFIEIENHKNFYDIEIKYLNNNLLYVKIFNKENKKWDEDLKIKIYDINNIDYEIISLGPSDEYYKEMEIYVDIDLYYDEPKNRKNIPNIVYYNKNINLNQKNEYYNYKNFLYSNKYYNINSDMSIIYNNVKSIYTNLDEMLNYVENENIKLQIYVLIYLNRNGGIFINDSFNLCNIDEINTDENKCYIDNNKLDYIFSKIKFIDENIIIDDLKNKKNINFEYYLNDFNIINQNDKTLKNELVKNDYDYVFNFEDYDFFIQSNKNIKYNIEKLPNNYFCLNYNDKKEILVNMNILDKKNNKEFKFDKSLIKNRFEDNVIFKL